MGRTVRAGLRKFGDQRTRTADRAVWILRQLQIAEGRMKLPRLTTGEAVNLQKQILDLTEQLRDLSAFSSARVLDS